MDLWVKLPTEWILNKEILILRKFRWQGADKSNYIAALMLYIAIAHHANRKITDELSEIGCAKLSYTKLGEITSLSRAKIAGGLKILLSNGLIEKNNLQKTNIFRIMNYEKKGGWAKLPANILYTESLNCIGPFMEFKLRQKNELNALKLYLLLVALRDNNKNRATPKYETISNYTGILRGNIRSAISLLVNLNMIHVEKYGDPDELEKRNNFYRIIGIENYRHSGNISLESLLSSNLNAE